MIFELEKLTKGSHDAYIDLYESINRIYRSTIKNNRHGWMDEWMAGQNKKMYIQFYSNSCYESINQIYRSTIKNNRHVWMNGWMTKTKRCIYRSTMIHVMNP